MIRFSELTDQEVNAIERICARARKTLSIVDPMCLVMDVSAAHLFDPLNLEKFEGFGAFDFAHDIYGIMGHIQRDTGELVHFLPRCSA